MTAAVRRFVIVTLALCLGGGVGGPSLAKEPTLNERVSTFKKALRSKDPKARARAFDYLRGAKKAALIDHVTWGLKQVKSEGAAIRKAQAVAEKEYEGWITQLNEAQAEFDASSRTGRDMDRYNKRERKISKGRDSTIRRLKTLENDFTRNRATFMQAVLVAAEFLEQAEGEVLADALSRLWEQWMGSKDIEDKLRWIDAVSECRQPEVAEYLQGATRNAELPTVVRTGVIDALARRKSGWMLGEAVAMLKLPIEQSPLLLAAIKALRRIHDSRAIEPLMDFLGRQDLKRERGDARKALVSLTGLDHGPHPGQWKKWWEDEKAKFVMPKEPKPTGNVAAPDKGVTFYGIHTFSDRILFIVDISGSMDRQAKGEDAGGKTKMEICKKELMGAVWKMNEGETFNVIFFNHQVIPWQARKVEVSKRTKKMLGKWVEEQQPLGATNIFDSLEMGFKIAHRTTGRADLDTIFFLTDGKPTAGKIRDPKRILEIIRDMNEHANMTIHAIGIGKDHDAEFMKELAKIGDGRYVVGR